VKVYNITSDYIFDVKPSKSEITEFQNRWKNIYQTPTRTRILRWFQRRFDPRANSPTSCRIL